MRRFVFACALLVVTAPSTAQDSQLGPAAPNAESTAESARRGRVYAQIGERAIRVGDIEDALAAQTPYQQARYRGDPALLREFADRLVQLELLAHEAEKRNLGNSPRVRELVESNLVQLLMRHAIDDHVTPRSIADTEIQAFYDTHLEDYARPELVRASHVLVATQAEAQTLLEQCRSADIAAFQQLARDRSLDNESNQTGGDLRYFTRDGRTQGNVGRPIAGPLAAASFAIAEVGTCAAVPVQLGDRWSVIKLTGRRAGEVTPLTAAQEGIRRRLWRERRDGALDELVTEIRGRVRVVQHNELVRKVDVAPPDPSELGHAHGEAPTAASGDSQHGNPLARPRPSTPSAPSSSPMR